MRWRYLSRYGMIMATLWFVVQLGGAQEPPNFISGKKASRSDMDRLEYADLGIAEDKEITYTKNGNKCVFHFNLTSLYTCKDFLSLKRFVGF